MTMTNEQFNGEINELWAQTKAGHLPRQERFDAIEKLTERYFNARGKQPEPAHLDRLATLCLYEEMSDTDRMKSRNNEYAILSGDQIERREDGEVTFTLAEEVGTDGRDYRPQTRLNRRKLKKF